MNARSFQTPAHSVSLPAEIDSIDLSLFVSRMWQRKWRIMLAVLAGLLLAYALVIQVTPKYAARATVMLDSRELQILASDEVISDLKLSNSVMDTEVAVLRSNTLLSTVVASLPAEALTEYDPANAPVSRFRRVRGWVSERLLRGNVDNNESVSSVPASPQDIEDRRIRRLVNTIRRDLLVWRDGQSYIINVSLTTEDPDLSALIANRIVEAYIETQIALRADIVKGVTEFLAAQAKDLQLELEAAETAIEEFRRTQLDEIGVTASTLERQLADLSTQLAVARSDLAIANSRLQQITSVISVDGIEVASQLLSSPLVQSLRQQMQDLRGKDATLALEFGEGHPERRALRASMDQINTALETEVNTIIANLRNEVEVGQIRAETLRTNLLEFEERAAELSRASLTLRQLEREAAAVRSNFESVLDRLNETRSIQQLQRADARIVERAQAPSIPSEPRVMLFTAFGGTVGFMIGCVLVALRVLSSDGLRRPSDLEAALGIPVVSSIPRENFKSLPQILAAIQSRPAALFAERLRLLRTSLSLRVKNGPLKTIMVTSALPNEGKSSTAVALAHIESRARRRCVLVEFDMRRCTIAEQLGYEPPMGDLNGLLLNLCDLDDAIWSEPSNGFDLISTKHPDPQLLDCCDEKALESLFQLLKTHYDTIIVDTGPVGFVADTLSLAKFADVVLMLVKQETTPKSAVVEASSRLRDAGSKEIVLALTMANRKDLRAVGGRYATEGYTYGHG